ncbi:coatomer protein complex subunit zeta2 [Capsaspora owczarzaki ATCC 30864]|uniref:coatomer protein complex subunit zeta2 n=1 Tax=Capsaspora owczarzaki (strain ATCC 30864) TaxID=595528 RepID=UPI000352350B|nr:coatomer protein complex subunit zeta2 [Capsaspora owczarzaki ATCC 30864]|eukprot:XP_004343002.2 coatomer protein complex subunit zeta2 [Capsaspora owczarzaki ATCC 30864]
MASLASIKAVLTLDNDGERVLCRYFDPAWMASVKEQRAFEKSLFTKTYRAASDIIMLEGVTCVYKSSVDLFFYVIGAPDENELLLSFALNTYFDALAQMLRNQVEKRVVMENFDVVALALDELVDGGIILEADPAVIVQHVAVRNNDEVPIAEQSISQALQTAKEQLSRSFLK